MNESPQKNTKIEFPKFTELEQELYDVLLDEYNEILEIIFVIVGAIIGAGFASGKEIYLFFYIYGIKGVLGAIISTAIMGITIYKTLKITRTNNIKSYNDFLEITIKNLHLRRIIILLRIDRLYNNILYNDCGIWSIYRAESSY